MKIGVSYLILCILSESFQNDISERAWTSCSLEDENPFSHVSGFIAALAFNILPAQLNLQMCKLQSGYIQKLNDRSNFNFIFIVKSKDTMTYSLWIIIQITVTTIPTKNSRWGILYIRNDVHFWVT